MLRAPLASVNTGTLSGVLAAPPLFPVGPRLVGVIDAPTMLPTPNSTTSMARTIDLSQDIIDTPRTAADNIAIAAKLTQEPIAQAADAVISRATGIERSPVVPTPGPVITSDYVGPLWSARTRGVVDTRATGTGPSVALLPAGLVIERAADETKPAPQALTAIESAPIVPSRKPWALIAAAAALGAFLLLRKR